MLKRLIFSMLYAWQIVSAETTNAAKIWYEDGIELTKSLVKYSRDESKYTYSRNSSHVNLKAVTTMNFSLKLKSEEKVNACAGPFSVGYHRPDRKTAHNATYQLTSDIGWHKLYTKGKSWNDARLHCQADGGHLAIADCGSERQILVDLIAKSNSKSTKDTVVSRAWIGAHDLFEEGSFSTVLDSPFKPEDRREWHSSKQSTREQPNNGVGTRLGTPQNCVQMMQDGYYNDYWCDMEIPYICELPIYR